MRVIRFALPMAATAVALVAGLAHAAPPPPDLKLFAADPAISGVAVAPDGRAVAYVQTTPQGRAVVILPEGSAGARLLPAGALDVTGLDWIDGDHLLIYHRLVAEALPVLPRQTITEGAAFNIRTGRSSTLLNGMAGVAPLLAGGPISFGAVAGKPMAFVRGLVKGPAFNLFAIDPETGRGDHMATESLDADEWVVAPDGAVVAEIVHASAKRPLVLRMRSGARHREVDLGERPFRLRGLGRAPGTVVVDLSGDLREVGADAVLGPPLLPAGEHARRLLFNGVTRRLAAIVRADPRSPPLIFDPALATAWPRAARPFAGKLPQLVGASADATQVVVSAGALGTPPTYYWADLKTARAEPIGEAAPQLAAMALAGMAPFPFTAADGARLLGRLLLPPGVSARSLPVVVMAWSEGDGGWSGSGFDPFAQALASRGYAVLQVAGRGAPTGDGSGPSQGEDPAGDVDAQGQLGRQARSDISDALAELARETIADPARACILGQGLGGYAALAGVTVQHGIYRCAVAIAPVVDLRQRTAQPDAELRGPAWRHAAAMRRMLGADASGPGLSEVSPLDHATEGSAPVLLVQEADDAVAQVQETERMRSALSKARRDVELVTLKARTESLGRSDGREALYAAVLAFLARADPA